MGSVAKILNPVTAVKSVVSAIKGDDSGGTTVVEVPAEATQEDAVTKANKAQYMAKTRGDNQADVSGVPAVGADRQASVPTSLSGLGGVKGEENKLGRRKALGV